MTNKVILICSELWRLKRRHYSKRRDGTEVGLINAIAELIAQYHCGLDIDPEIRLRKTNWNKKKYKATSVKLELKTVEKLRTLARLDNRSVANATRAIILKFFKENEGATQIKIKRQKNENSKT